MGLTSEWVVRGVGAGGVGHCNLDGVGFSFSVGVVTRALPSSATSAFFSIRGLQLLKLVVYFTHRC